MPVESALDTLRRLHAVNWGDRSRFLAGFDRFRAAALTGAERGEFTLHELAVDGEVITSVAAFELAGRLTLYQSGRSADRRWRGSTTIVLSRAVEDACRRGFTEVDLLRGGEDYKRNFASATRAVLRLRAATGPAGHLMLRAFVLRDWSRRLAGRLLRRLQSLARQSRAPVAFLAEPGWLRRRQAPSCAPGSGGLLASPRPWPSPPRATGRRAAATDACAVVGR
jgi:CelD/BcsL family acetyltransferase involved in cellulose biosynthesis